MINPFADKLLPLYTLSLLAIFNRNFTLAARRVSGLSRVNDFFPNRLSRSRFRIGRLVILIRRRRPRVSGRLPVAGFCLFGVEHDFHLPFVLIVVMREIRIDHSEDAIFDELREGSGNGQRECDHVIFPVHAVTRA
jgi:hypothetical protein